MVRFAIYVLIVFLVTRALLRLWGGVREGLRGQPASSGIPQRGVQMVRDPVCGTFVVRERALRLTAGGEDHFFCSAACRDKYQPARPQGRTA
jgi:YHS domain-containing protein